jgi:hypothetical protein
MTSTVSRKSVSPSTRAKALSLTNPPNAVRGNAGLALAALACATEVARVEIHRKSTEAPSASSAGPPVYEHRDKDIPLQGAVVFSFFAAGRILAINAAGPAF